MLINLTGDRSRTAVYSKADQHSRHIKERPERRPLSALSSASNESNEGKDLTSANEQRPQDNAAAEAAFNRQQRALSMPAIAGPLSDISEEGSTRTMLLGKKPSSVPSTPEKRPSLEVHHESRSKSVCVEHLQVAPQRSPLPTQPSCPSKEYDDTVKR